MLYIRSLEHYISRDFIKSLNSVGLCLEDAPDFWQVWYLRRTILNRTETDCYLAFMYQKEIAFQWYASTSESTSVVYQVGQTSVTCQFLGMLPSHFRLNGVKGRIQLCFLK